MAVFTNFSSKGRTVSDLPGVATLGEMNFAFMDFGQGDCTVIADPDNGILVVDCGSVSFPANGINDVVAMIQGWANGGRIRVVLTHPDQDHYNQIVSVCSTIPVTLVDHIYFSRAQSNESPLGYYVVNALGANQHVLGFPEIHEITINEMFDQEKIWNNSNQYEAPVETLEIPEAGYVVASGQTMDEIDWSIKIIAGNVTADGPMTEQSNAASLITLIEFGEQKALLMGDATTETMNYLLNNQADQIGNINIFQMPHHGSENNIPSVAFRNLVNPYSIVVSVGLLSNNFHFPRNVAIDFWSGGTNLRDNELVLDLWEYGSDDYTTNEDLNRIINEIWNAYPVSKNGSNTFYWLTHPEDADPDRSNTGFYGFTNNYFFLYRHHTVKDIWATGIEGTSEESFTEGLFLFTNKLSKKNQSY